MKISVKTTHLEMTDRGAHRRARPPSAPLLVKHAEHPSPELGRFFYAAVGAAWLWYERLTWDEARWRRYLQRPELELWVAEVAGAPAGYYELERVGSDVEIRSFGLLPAFIGHGLGGALLSHAIDRGWAGGAERVWLHTCTLDHPRALENYQARGFRIFRVEEALTEVPDEVAAPATAGARP